MKKLFSLIIIIFLSNFVKSQDECGTISELNSKFLLIYSVAEMNYTTNYYYLDTCCIALELLQTNNLPKLSNKKNILVLESSFFVDKNLINQHLNLILDISNCQKRIYLNGNFIAIIGENNNLFKKYLIEIQLPNNLVKYNNISNELTIQIYPNQNFDYKLINNYILSDKLTDSFIFRQNYFPRFCKF